MTITLAEAERLLPAHELPEFRVQDPDFEARVRASFDAQAIMRTIGAVMTVCAPGICEIELPWSEMVTQQDGFYHGGIVGAVADSACGYACHTLMRPQTRVLTVEYKLNLMAPAVGRKLVARARVLRSGRTLSVAQCDVFGDRDGRPVFCAASQSTLIEVGEA